MENSVERYNRWRDPIFWLILIFGVALRAVRLHFPDEPCFDEVYYQPAAEDYLQLRPDENSVHPPLAKIQIAAVVLFVDTIKAWGVANFSPMIGGRLASLLAGIGTLWFTHRMAFTLSGRRLLANLTLFLVAVDFLSIAQSRIIMLDQVQTFWIVAGLAITAEVLFERKGFDQIVFAGLCFGVATACKWSGFFAAVGAWLALMGAVSRPRGEVWACRSWVHRMATTLIFLLCGVLVYAASYIPFLLTEKTVNQESVHKIVGFHDRMLKFRYDPEQFKHRYLSRFYEWPLVSRPVWYHYNEEDKVVRGIVGIGNVAFWWPAFFLVLESLWLGYFARLTKVGSPLGGGFPEPLSSEGGDPANDASPADSTDSSALSTLPCPPSSGADSVSQFICCSYYPQWLFWALGTTGGFFYYMLPMVPIMAVAMARHLEELWLERLGRRLAYGYICLMLVLTVLYYPLITGIPVSEAYFHRLFFVDRWI